MNLHDIAPNDDMLDFMKYRFPTYEWRRGQPYPEYREHRRGRWIPVLIEAEYQDEMRNWLRTSNWLRTRRP